jgi:hypothetical protein
MTGCTEIGFSTKGLDGTGVSVGADVMEGTGVSVTMIGTLVGVHEGTKVNLGVTVGVRVNKAGFNVGGGNGLRLLFGLRKMSVKYDKTHPKATRIRTVKIFHTRALGLFVGGGPFTSETSYVSTAHLPVLKRLWH